MKKEKVEKRKTELSKHGIPCLWESGGAWTNTGYSTIISNVKGGPKTPLYIRQRGELACSSHALIPITRGDYVISVDRHRDDVEIEVQQIVELQKDTATLDNVAVFSEGEWDFPPPQKLSIAIHKAIDKSRDYHCRRPYFIKERGDQNE